MTLTLVVIISWLLAYVRAGLRVWTVTVFAVWGSSAYFGGYFYSLFLLGLTIPLALIFNLPALRRAILTKHLLKLFKRMLPPLSETERVALEAGTVGWDGELFSGSPDWGKLLSYPAPQLTAAEQAFLNGPVEDLCRMLDDWRIVEHDKDLPPAIWQFLKQHRFFGLIIPAEYGGLAFSAHAHSQVIMKIASRSITGAVTVMVPNSLGPAELLLHYGTQDQKNHYLPLLASGDEIPCFALTGPEAGSDAAAIPDRGIICHGIFNGREILGIRLTWEKRYITLGPVATLLGLAFKLSDPDRLFGNQSEIGITLALIPVNTPGISIGTRHMPLGIPFQNGPNWGKDVFIPMDWIIGGPERAGDGWRMLMECLGVGRAVSLPALSTGAGKLVCRATGAYARIRRQFKLPIGHLEGIEEPLSRMAGLTYQMEAARVITSVAVDRGEKPSVLSAIVKYSLTERMRRAVNDAMDVQGGSGICLGPHNILGRIYQAIPIGITVEGANILTRTMIIFGQGAVRCHPYVLKEIRAVTDPDSVEGLINFDRAFFGHVGFTISIAARALWLGISGARLQSAPGGPAKRIFQIASRLDAAFVLAADMSMIIIGSGLKRREKLSGRLADILAELYLVSAVLKQFEDNGRPADELPLLEWACASSFHAIQLAFTGLFTNFPNRFAALLLRLAAFPLGIPNFEPSDHLGHQVSAILLSPSAVRDRLTAGIYTPPDLSEPLGRLDDALYKVIAAEQIEKKIRDAAKGKQINAGSDEQMLQECIQAGIVTAKEAESVSAAQAARRDVIRVDDFPADYWNRGGSHE